MNKRHLIFVMKFLFTLNAIVIIPRLNLDKSFVKISSYYV
jgi:hypothetical protein